MSVLEQRGEIANPNEVMGAEQINYVQVTTETKDI